MWERERRGACDYLSCARVWDGRKVGREEWDMTSSLQRDILLQAKQIRHIIHYWHPSNDSNKPNKDTMQLEREREKQTNRWRFEEEEEDCKQKIKTARLLLLHTKNVNCVALFQRLVSCLQSQHFKASFVRFQCCSKSKQLNYAAS